MCQKSNDQRLKPKSQPWFRHLKADAGGHQSLTQTNVFYPENAVETWTNPKNEENNHCRSEQCTVYSLGGSEVFKIQFPAAANWGQVKNMFVVAVSSFNYHLYADDACVYFWGVEGTPAEVFPTSCTLGKWVKQFTRSGLYTCFFTMCSHR